LRRARRDVCDAPHPVPPAGLVTKLLYKIKWSMGTWACVRGWVGRPPLAPPASMGHKGGVGGLEEGGGRRGWPGVTRWVPWCEYCKHDRMQPLPPASPMVSRCADEYMDTRDWAGLVVGTGTRWDGCGQENYSSLRVYWDHVRRALALNPPRPTRCRQGARGAVSVWHEWGGLGPRGQGQARGTRY
jgi:hypothetical protein